MLPRTVATVQDALALLQNNERFGKKQAPDRQEMSDEGAARELQSAILP